MNYEKIFNDEKEEENNKEASLKYISEILETLPHEELLRIHAYLKTLYYS